MFLYDILVFLVVEILIVVFWVNLILYVVWHSDRFQKAYTHSFSFVYSTLHIYVAYEWHTFPHLICY